MTEYTSLEVSKRLAVVGFHADIDGFLVDEGDGMFKWKRNDPLPRLDRDGLPILESYSAYRADTLMAWLIARGHQVAVGKSYDKKRYTAFYTYEAGEQNTRCELSDTISDALAEAVMKVVEVSK